MKISFSAFLLLALVFSPCVLELTLALVPPPTTTAPSFCDGKCGDRCAQAGYQDRCLKYCKICCEECKCVPSGTYGNKSECPCYRDKLNSKGKPKCP